MYIFIIIIGSITKGFFKGFYYVLTTHNQIFPLPSPPPPPIKKIVDPLRLKYLHNSYEKFS
jgi:hypothetical protein